MSGQFISKHIQYMEDGQVEKLLCRECGDTVYGWVDFAKPEDNGKTGVIRQRPMKLDNYAKLAFCMSDKSIYTPPWCVDCADARAKSGFSDEELEAVYSVELEAWEEKLFHEQPHPKARQFMERMTSKHITRFIGRTGA